ncbi:pyridoxamine 5'-phosphate oxidase family protein [Solirubrobacter phytolaccae]|uniref:Pyridoxamine 5'-phosphate oxidase family protein n=1 Tax=Solirubrobacter phytolaccae TaxID=1404360 RepID=A0A9X3N7A1_9ACTN|nr:pyridoxamine 5'-phosphate oxidase family protein [Solirubrobacter phytolaccae]MDA0179602.1 pyridoxamine 5'-phosphate oxidase family protein [Solirubrobacter phytolaccae]
MATWNEFETAAPDLADRIRASFKAHTHLTIATLRKDGAPRISGTEVQFEGDDLWIGSMANALKAKDLQRDPRFALHSGSVEPDEGLADAKIAGHAHGVPNQEHHKFRLEVSEASIVSLDDAKEHLIIDLWTADGGVKQIKRK